MVWRGIDAYFLIINDYISFFGIYIIILVFLVFLAALCMRCMLAAFLCLSLSLSLTRRYRRVLRRPRTHDVQHHHVQSRAF